VAIIPADIEATIPVRAQNLRSSLRILRD